MKTDTYTFMSFDKLHDRILYLLCRVFKRAQLDDAYVLKHPLTGNRMCAVAEIPCTKFEKYLFTFIFERVLLTKSGRCARDRLDAELFES